MERIEFFDKENVLVDMSTILEYKDRLTFGNGGSRDHSEAGTFLDESEIESIFSTLQWNADPRARSWDAQMGVSHSYDSDLSQFYNYGLNEALVKHLVKQQIRYRITRNGRVPFPAPFSGSIDQNASTASWSSRAV